MFKCLQVITIKSDAVEIHIIRAALQLFKRSPGFLLATGHIR